MTKIAVLGTGLMGAPMARHLGACFDISVWNRNPDRALPLADIARVARDPVEAVSDADVVISMLLDGEATEAVLIGKGAIEAARPGALVIDMGSVEPECDRRLADFASCHGKHFIDAPVSGGVVGAEAASLSIFVGGSTEDFEYAFRFLSALGRPTHMGPVGSGQVAKLANQLIVAITIGAVAEALHLAENADCDPAVLVQALKGGFADSRILDLHGNRMVKGDFQPGGRSAAQLKDLRNALDAAAQAGLTLPLARTVTDGFADLVNNKGGADLDHAAYFLWLKSLC
ncbi:NAD(P)-dependent oxidoreductase (plasmid) [Ensifer adhaerens]|uniref:NAD(P)-dependent oxidoreductase n=1 Tax=Ensifer adhaerens TaxID=106592 RepID=UPI0023A9E96F|nr:NAD(P)-dependent oxidoreductase [Ensifer adhaerens]WDZ82042.1 NAD(P)-dependent oxidoreductase [Ensifer adhaerens]